MLAWSGGKDAAWSLHRLRRSGMEVVALLSTLTCGDERASMQGVRGEVLHAQAGAAGLPLVEAWIEANAPNAAYEASLAAALARCRRQWPQVDTLAFGDLQDVRDWRAALCDRLGWRLATPLFGSDTTALAHEMIDGGVRANLCCVDTTQLAAHFLGMEFTAALLGQLPAGGRPLRRERRIPYVRTCRPDVRPAAGAGTRRGLDARRTLRLCGLPPWRRSLASRSGARERRRHHRWMCRTRAIFPSVASEPGGFTKFTRSRNDWIGFGQSRG